MQFSEIWLSEWVDMSINSNKLHDQLTMAGFQVEESNPVYQYKFFGIVIGSIIEYRIHPCLDNTWIIKINNGSSKLINVICNNINCRKNLRVVVANMGALLPNGRIVSSVMIEQEKSEGILCTYSMLKLNNYTEYIIELPEDAPIGMNFYDYLNLNDNIININITPNRGDCYSIIGLSREIAAINQSKLKKLKIAKVVSTIHDIVPVIIQVPEQCPKFLGRILKNVNTSVSTPLKIQEKLRRCGVQPINVVMDIIHYVLLELGYPIYAFDYDKIDQGPIYIRHSNLGETLELSEYNNIVLKLFNNTLIISDCSKPLAIAGVIIGSKFRVSVETRNVFLQSACFNPKTVLTQSQIYNLYTVESVRYESKVDLNLSELALNYVTFLLLKICNGYAGPITQVVSYNHFPKSDAIILNQSKLDRVVGFCISEEKIKLILSSLGFQIIKIKNNLWKILPPSWRFDILIEEDLISEIIRIHGYDKVPKISFIHSSLKKLCTQSITAALSRAKTTLVDRGYHEIITYSFVNPNIQKLLYPQYTSLALINPINLDMSVMRLSLWTGLIKTVIYNQNRQQKRVLLFESGICFIPKKNNTHQVSQKLMVSGIRAGFKFNMHWDSVVSVVDFYDIKGDVEAVLNINANKYNNNIIFKSCHHPALHPKQSASIYLNDMCIGYVGMIHPIIQRKLNLRLDTLMFELFWDTFVKYKLPVKITNVSKFPKNYRDISLMVPTSINSGDIIDICKKIDPEQLIEVKLIDVYLGHEILLGYKSYTIQLILQSQTHTLKEKEISKIIDKCIMILKKRFHAVLR